ncbi:hypothetical protein P7C70_g1702, partial [Phenoliferia sp. Uapishka_3]
MSNDNEGRTPYVAHLLVICHGLWGTRAHVAYLGKSALEQCVCFSYLLLPSTSAEAPTPPSATVHRSSSSDTFDDANVRLIVLPASQNEDTRTYDGIDYCAERVVTEIDAEVKRIEEDGGTVKRFSIVGYSLGGLVASVNDRTVPYPTGAIEAHDPFALARAKAKKRADERGDDPDVEPDIIEGGLEIKLDSTGLLIESYRVVFPPPPSPKSHTPKRSRYTPRLPLLLRPTTYPFSRPLSLLIIVSLPIALPLLVTFLVVRFFVSGQMSQRRIRSFRKGIEGGRKGMLDRVGLRLREAMEEAVESGVGGSEEMESERSGDGEGKALRKGEGLVRGYGGTGGTETPVLARSASPGQDVDPEATGSLAHPYPTDPILSPAQAIMIRNLNSIPQLRKHLAYMPLVRNSHGSIVARDLSYEAHREGRKVVDSWAKEFRL